MVRELAAANAQGQAEKLGPVENILLELREAWVEAAQIYAREKKVPSVTGSSIAAAL
jgi:flagellin-specific chaperone FliS